MTFARPYVRLALSVLILMAAAAALPAKADDWPDPAKWSGKSPVNGLDGATFYQLTSVRAALLSLVGEQFYWRVLLAWNQYSPVIAAGDAIFVEGCKPQACDSNQVTTVIQGRSVTVCLYHASPPITPGSPPWPPEERLWFIEGVGMPGVERDPADDNQCRLESVEDFVAMAKNGKALAERW